MNLFFLWRPDLYESSLFSVLFILYHLLVLILVLLSYRIKDLWMKRFVRYYTPISLIVLNNFFRYFVRIEEGRMRISEYHIINGPPVIDSKLGVFFVGVEITSLFIAVVSLLFFSSFKVSEKVLHKFRSRSKR